MIRTCNQYCIGFNKLIITLLLTLLIACEKQEVGNSTIPGKIVYAFEYNDIHTINPNGNNQQTVASELDYLSWRHSPWSPDAEWIAFMRRDTARHHGDICIIKHDGSSFSKLTSDTIADMLPHWSPNGERILFEIHLSTSHNIFVINKDGTDLKRLTDYTGYDIEAAWSPYGDKIAFLSNRFNIKMGGYELWLMNTDGSEQEMLLDLGHIQRFTWSPDGARIALHGHSGSQIFDIYVLNSDGTSLENLTNSTSVDLLGAWSPDGTQIAFQSDRDGNKEIYLINIGGNELIRLTNNSAQDFSPTWSPDGKWLCFIREIDGISDLYIINTEGTIEIQLTNTIEDEGRAYWSPQ